jgi:DNA-binding IclR family transcriptional regulator
LLDIIGQLGENDEAFPSQEIACNLGLSESTVKSAINVLVKKKFIKTARRRGHVNRYGLTHLKLIRISDCLKPFIIS